MKRSGQLARSCVGLTLFVAFASQAFAQTCEDVISCEIVGTGAGGIAIDIGSEIPLLRGFQLEFLDNDHPIKNIVVGVKGPSSPDVRGEGVFRFALRDNDGSEEIKGRAKYFAFRDVLAQMRVDYGLSSRGDVGVLRSVSRRGCPGWCALTIPGYDAAETTLFLAGFGFAFPDGEHNFGAMGIRTYDPGEPPGTLRVWFRDNERDRRFDVFVSYVLIPNDYKLTDRLYSGVSATDDQGAVHMPGFNRGGRAITGFWVGYYGDDEHVLKLGVWLDRTGGTVILRDNDTRESINPWISSHILPVLW